MIVLDTSLVGPIAIPDEHGNLSPRALADLLDSTLVVPSHWRLEVANMLRTAVRRERLTRAQRDEVLSRLALLELQVDRDTWNKAWTATVALSDRLGLTPYDAAYVELARRRSLPLATRDAAMARAAVAVGVTVEAFAA